MRPVLALLLALAPMLATEAPADTPVSPSEFREYAEGYTLYFKQDDEPVGAEAFGPEGHVTWRTPEGLCIEGLWRPHDGNLCFYYGVGDVVECWEVLRDAQGLKVRRTGAEDDAGEATYRIAGRDRQPLLCSGEPALQTRARPGLPVSPPALRR